MGTFTTSGAVNLKCGTNRNSSITENMWNEAIVEAENFISTYCRADFSGAYATLTTPFKFSLGDVASSLAAIKIISWDMSGYTNLNHAEDLINVNYDRAFKQLDVLKDSKWKEKIGVQ